MQNSQNKLMKYLLYTMLLACLSACTSTEDAALEQALRRAGDNRNSLESVLKHYKGDSLKYEAACFLIKNMPYHFSIDEYYLSPDGVRYRPDIAAFGSKEALKAHCDSLLRYGYVPKSERHPDIMSLDSAFIVHNIELAFDVWRKPWAKDVSFDDFCRYILPYRAQTEKASLLRGEMMERFIPLLDSAKVTNSIEACTTLNTILKKVVRYQDTGLSLYPTIDETYRAGIGRCEAMCNLGAFIMRASGIPVVIDFTTWPKIDLGHSWCAVLDEGHFYAFGIGEQQPNVYVVHLEKSRKLRPAKVYRFQFAMPNVSTPLAVDDGYQTILKSPLVTDVTKEYLSKPTQIRIAVNGIDQKRSKTDQVYLCVHNYYKWIPIAIGNRVGEECVFDEVVGDNIFIVGDCLDGKSLHYITPPVYVNTEGKPHEFIPQEKTDSVVLKKRPRKKSQPHTLSYWDVKEQGFVALNADSETDSTKTYHSVPRNALLWFTIPERIFNQR
ncbi:MAG: transglutaminase domain-containing protein [Mediterranea sp.]|jgi:hypothetical protein|nr:transglutaminase domain-containing protein [Mediterranea sp.]